MGSMRSPQKLAYIEAENSVVRVLGNLIELRKLGVIKLRTDDGNDLCSSVEKMNHLQAFSARSMDAEELLDLQSLSYPPPTLQRLCLRGRLLKLPQWIASLDNLVSVCLRWSRLRDDPLKGLQSLPNLVELFLERAYDGEELCCEAGGYPRFKDLSLLDLKELKKVRIENGAMYCLEKLRIRRCEELGEVALGLENLTNLKMLYLVDFPFAFLRGLTKDGKGVYLPFNVVDGIKVPTGMGSMRSPQKLAYIEAENSVVRVLGNLIELRKLGVIKLRTDDGNDLCSSVEKMNHLQAFSARSMDAEELLDLQSLSYPPPTLQRLCLRGRLLKLPQWIASLDNLVSVCLRWSRLRDDPLKGLQSLPNLVELFLERAYDGEELCCEAGGYPRFKDLSLLDLKELKKVRIENGAMYCLEKLRIRRCEELGEVALGLENLTNLKMLYLVDFPFAFLRGLTKDGFNELVNSIQHIPLIRYIDTKKRSYTDFS
ncbi:disease resistance protein RPM1-like [Magnolia sinica]|uniref:disease resistance protein RPM1-like n=1 Tax=Magnolia sinica TaxID=86752 RepID=UPI002658A95D|nr:disease resistance protein RPM1-like [Magnolia sinica]